MLLTDLTRKVAAVAITSALVALLFWKGNDEARDSDPDSTADTEADSFITGANVIEFDSEGKTSLMLKSAEAKQFSKYDRVIFDQPDISLHDSSGMPWHIHALTGRYHVSQAVLELKDDIEIQRINQAGTADLTMTTRSLIIDKNKKYITSDERVTFVTPGSDLEGIGMQAWIDEKKVVLNSRVQGVFNPVRSSNAN